MVINESLFIQKASLLSEFDGRARVVDPLMMQSFCFLQMELYFVVR